MRAALLTVVSLVLLIAAVVAAIGVVNARDDAADADDIARCSGVSPSMFDALVVR